LAPENRSFGTGEAERGVVSSSWKGGAGMPDTRVALPTPGRRADLDKPGMILGRPVEDRTFEAVEVGVGVATRIGIGTAVAGPFGAAVGGVVGAAVGIIAEEAVERAAGPAATTTDTSEQEEP
jgi:hypothetical protein